MTHPESTEPPHDILAAEEFEIGTRDERIPPDPSGIHEPHDVLAAEEFAMPAPDAIVPEPGGRTVDARALAGLAVLIGLVLLALRRRS